MINQLRDNLERANTSKGGSAVANRACELLGKTLGMFADDQPKKPETLEDLSDADLQKLLKGTAAEAVAEVPGPVQ